MTKKFFENPTRYVIFDSETTGLGSKDQIVELAAINFAGETLFNQRFHPSVAINPKAQAVHGISIEQLANEPTFDKHAETWENATNGKMLIAYNIKFDARLLTQTYAAVNRQKPSFPGACAMDMATKYNGQVSKLVGGNHSALGDCAATLDLFRRFLHQTSPTDIHEGVDAILNLFGISPPPFA